MDHLQVRCGGLHMLNVVNLTYEMVTYYGDAAFIPEYIIMLEDAQQKVQ